MDIEDYKFGGIEEFGICEVGELYYVALKDMYDRVPYFDKEKDEFIDYINPEKDIMMFLGAKKVFSKNYVKWDYLFLFGNIVICFYCYFEISKFEFMKVK